MINANSNTAMSAQLSAVPHLPEWEICRTTKTDRRNARQHLKHIVEFDEADQAMIRKQVRYLVGFSVPDEVLFIIKSYLLIDRERYTLIYNFRMMTQAPVGCSHTHIPRYHLLTLAEENGLIRFDGMFWWEIQPIDGLTKNAVKMIQDAISKRPISEQNRLYKTFTEYGNNWRETVRVAMWGYKEMSYSTYLRGQVKAEYTRAIKGYETIPIQDLIDHPKWYPDPYKYTLEHRYADVSTQVINQYSEIIGSAGITSEMAANIIRCFDGTIDYIECVGKDYGLGRRFTDHHRQYTRLPYIRNRIRIRNLPPRSPMG
jgi:hypothetical protein